MLVLSRKPSEVIRLGEDIKITIIRIGPNVVRIGIEAPKHIGIVREELIDSPSEQKGVATCNEHRTSSAKSNA